MSDGNEAVSEDGEALTEVGEGAPQGNMSDGNEAVSEDGEALTEEGEGAPQVSEQETQPDVVEDGGQLPVDMFYDYEQLVSKASVSPESDIPLHLLHLSHSFGYDCKRRANLQLLDEQTLLYIAGNMLVLQDMSSMEQKHLRCSSGGGIGAITTHPNRQYFAMGEKGSHPNILVFEYPSLRPYRILRGGTVRAYCHLNFSSDGALLASVGAAPDYMLTLWDWRQEEVVLSCKAVSQDVYRVSFSPHNPDLLTSAGSGHIKFWKMVNTVTGLKLQGLMGHFGKTAFTDIEGYMALPDGKVVSGSDWGNLLLWDGNSIKVEICRKEGRPCHSGTVLPFALEEGQLLTTGADGAVRGWDFESINSADSHGEGSRFELEPMNELVIGHNVSLSSVVRSGQTDSFVWYAQDTMGAIWKLDLSFTHTTPDPECLFQFHSGAIQGMDVSRSSHLLATTALGRSVKVYDFLSNKQLTSGRFNQGGSALCWAPALVERGGGGLLVVGFEDGVVRLLDVFDPQRLQTVPERSRRGGAELRLRQAFKPHSASVSAVAYDRNARILATASLDCSVFFFSAGEKYRPIGFVSVPGPVRALEWSPHFHSASCLLVLCQTGHVLEVQSPDPEQPQQTQTFELSTLQTRAFLFKSIKSRIKREEEIARRQVLKEKKWREEQRKQAKDLALEPEEQLEEEEEELPSIYLPSPPSPLCCGFYSQPGRFWLAMGGYDAGFLYHCEFSESQDEDPAERQDEPFAALPIQTADQDPIVSITFSSERRLLLCGMTSGSLRVYPLCPSDYSLQSLQHYWTLSIHDNSYGAVRHVRLSYDDQFVLTAGDDGNIFSFSMLPPDELPQRTPHAKVPSPRAGLENEEVAQDIEDPSAYSIATAKHRLESERLEREAELKILNKQKKLEDLRESYRQLLEENQALPTHVRLQPQELCLDVRFVEQAGRLKEQRLREVQRMYGWEEERSRLALHNLQHWFKDSLSSGVVTVVAIASDHRVSTYRLPLLHKRAPDVRRPSQSSSSCSTGAEARKVRAELGKGSPSVTEEEVLKVAPLVTRPPAVKLADRQVERLKKAAEKAEQARAKIENRKKEWAQLYAEKPDENTEDPADVQAIQAARETVGHLNLKSAPDFTVPKHLRMNTERKRGELTALEDTMRRRQEEMNAQILALRDAKVQLVAHLQSKNRHLLKVQERLPAELHRPCPTLPRVLPEETPEKTLRYSPDTLLRYKELRQTYRAAVDEQEDQDLLLQLEDDDDDQSETTGQTTSQSDTPIESEGEEQVENTELEDEVQMEEQARLMHQQNVIIEQMEAAVREWDASLRMLLHQKLRLDQELKLADLRQLTVLQELLLLKHFERRENSLQERLSVKANEEDAITLRVEELTEQLESKRRDISKVHERLKALSAAFMASLGENNKFEEFLTQVFKKKIKRLKEKAADEAEQDEDSDGDTDDDSDWDKDEDEDDADDADLDEWKAPLDDSVCPPKCEPALFENTLQLRERKLDLEEQLQEEKKGSEALKKDWDTLAKKKKTVSSSRKALEEDLEMMQREKQQKMNELDVAVPLRLHQMEFLSDAELLTDLGLALVLDCLELRHLQSRISELQREKSHQRELFHQARQQHVRLQQECADMNSCIHALKEQCDELMMMKFGRLVDLQALQTLSGNRVLEELKQEKCEREAKYARDIKEWDLKVLEARENLMKATRSNTKRLVNLNKLFNQKKELEHKLHLRQKRMGREFENSQTRGDQRDIADLQELVRAQAEQAEALRTEIHLLSRKGGHILPPGSSDPAPQPPGPAHLPSGPHSSM